MSHRGWPMGVWTILYDADCGLCRVGVAALLAWDRHGRLRTVALQSERAAALLPSLSDAERLASWHVVRRGQTARGGGDAIPVVLALLPGGRLPAWLASRYPGLADLAYRWVAEHRSQLGGLLPRALRRWGARKIDEGERRAD